MKNPQFPRKRLSFKFTEPSLTEQSHKKDCDVNEIMRKYQKTGLVTHLNRSKPQYGDFSNAYDYHASLIAIQEANDHFLGLPSSIRDQFNNDPGAYLEFASNPENLESMAELGMLTDAQTSKIRDIRKKAEEKIAHREKPLNPPAQPKPSQNDD